MVDRVLDRDICWREMLALAMERYGDAGPVMLAPDDAAVWDRLFDSGYGGTKGKPVLAWTEERVYFPVVYDGAEWLESAPRHPRTEGQEHVGGE